jgi:hypothetical protein
MATDETAAVIEIRIERVSQLFNTFDPLPFREKDLDRDAEEFIVGWARELPKAQPLRIVVHLPTAESHEGGARVLGPALSRYFGYRADVIGRELKDLLRIGQRSLLIGLLVLALCLAAGQAAGNIIKGEIGQFIREGLVILGWVANWKPIEIFLFDWWAVARRRDLHRRLSAAKVDVRFGEAEPHTMPVTPSS